MALCWQLLTPAAANKLQSWPLCPQVLADSQATQSGPVPVPQPTATALDFQGFLHMLKSSSLDSLDMYDDR